MTASRTYSTPEVAAMLGIPAQRVAAYLSRWEFLEPGGSRRGPGYPAEWSARDVMVAQALFDCGAVGLHGDLRTDLVTEVRRYDDLAFGVMAGRDPFTVWYRPAWVVTP